jgi:hypothetical protein
MTVMLLMGLLACGLAFVRSDRAGFFLQCAAVQALPVVAGLLLSMLISADERVSFAPYGLFAMWFVMIGAAMRIEPWLTGSALSSPASRQ